MANPSKFYLSHMHAKTKYRATWDPTKQLMIGNIGKLDNGVLSIYSSLDKEGIPIELSTSSADVAMDYTSHDSVIITTKLSGATPQVGSGFLVSDAGFTIDFNGDNSVVFQTSNQKVHQLINLAEIEHTVLEKYDNGNWDRDWVIVTELIEADAATIIISNSNTGKLELKANAAIRTQSLTLTDTNLGLSVIHEKGSTLKYIAQRTTTPLYRVMGLRSAFLSNLFVGNKGVSNSEKHHERLVVLDYNEAEHY